MTNIILEEEVKMKTKIINLYSFDELSEEAKEKAEANEFANIIRKLDNNAILELINTGEYKTGNDKFPLVTSEHVIIKKEFHKQFANDIF